MSRKMLTFAQGNGTRIFLGMGMKKNLHIWIFLIWGSIESY